MIYIYRTLWLLFYILVFIIEILVFLIGLPLFMIMGIVFFIKTGDVEDTPDMFIPGRFSVMLDFWYKNLLDKLENNCLYE